MYSSCHRKIPDKLSLIGHLPLQRLSVYVHFYNASNMSSFMQLLPKTLKELIVFRTSELDLNVWRKDFDNTRFKVYMCHLNDILVDPEWMCGTNELLTHTIWLPPYKFSFNAPRLDMAEWYENISEDIEEFDEYDNKQVTRTAIERSETDIADNTLSTITDEW
ncbi:unnamed protein product [Anisakis simplex]|uniref:Uncharacterized protein n=1 Tax=Anisakis simplex TaxID=6269 RepID=A0A3P6T0G7_ANISI|nr:unnamed protein product [Anisakis simplex]